MGNKNYVEIESASPELADKIQQDLSFKNPAFVWQVKFNTALDPATVNNSNMFVTTAGMIPLKTKISYIEANNIIEVEPLEQYAKNEVYFLHITKAVCSKGGKNLKNDLKIQFKL